ncbi:nuclear pore complex protein NUP1-like isoform X2 [Mangifera indica]|uniref:nuclear pore complex protein NUP1-like isoform X2 n=1 Tax=Mangifera indica TaxID=29780 RepID=UPI001CF97866|nr:nuclear pore complex protein NUP1-like isoform X2 [Mangifera indica]
MATARDESGFGTGGKFRKRPFRRTTQSTPYDRPLASSALRNPANVNLNNNNGWLSKLVDPAHRLIVSSAYRLFGSVFRKQLPPPPPPPPRSTMSEPGNHGARDKHQELVAADDPGVQEAINCHDGPTDGHDRGLNELEQIFKQKTFTRSEIDRLTALLRSRTVGEPLDNEQDRSEEIPSNQLAFHERKEPVLNTPVKENGIVRTHNFSPVVVDEDVASPAELAKAYMGSRSFKVSPSMLGVRSQALREESTVLNNSVLPSEAAIMSLVPRSSGHVGVTENGYLTPRSRGRSAIYNMARTPYSQIHSTTTLKGVGLAVDSLSRLSSSTQGIWEKNRLTEPKQGTLKRRSSVLDNDIGSVGPIRRIRQKPNLLTSRNLSLPASGSSLCMRGSGVSSVVQQPSSSIQKPQISGEERHRSAKMLTENGDNNIPRTNYTPVQSKSSETAFKILQQLDKLVSTREKSPTKLSPSMLNGAAAKSLEDVDSSKFLENVQDNNRSGGSLDTLLPDGGDSTSPKQDKVEENGPTKFISPFDKSVSVLNGLDATGVVKDDMPGTKTTDSSLTNSIVHPYPQKKRGFQMSALEDKLDVPVVENKSDADEVIAVEKAPALSEVKTLNSVFNKVSDIGTNDGSVVAEKNSLFTFPTAPSSAITGLKTVVATSSALNSEKAILPNEPSGAPIFGFGEKFDSLKDSNVVSPLFGTSKTNVDKAPQFTIKSDTLVVNESSTPKFGTHLEEKPESLKSFTSVPVVANDSVPEVHKSDKADNGTVPEAEIFSRTPETALPSAASTSLSSASIFFQSASSASLNNGSLASSPTSTSSLIPLVSSTGINQNSSSSANSVSSFSHSTSLTTSTPTATPSMAASAPVFKFGASAVAPISVSPTLAPSGVESTEQKIKEPNFGNSTSMLFGGTSTFGSTGSSTSSGTSLAAIGLGSIFGSTPSTSNGSSIFSAVTPPIASTASGIFGGTSSAISSTGSGIFGGASSAISSTGSVIFGFSAGSTSASTNAQVSNPFSVGSAQASVNVTGVSTSTQSMPNQFGSTTSSTSFGLAGNPAFSSGSSLFGSTSVAKPFGSTPTFGLNSTSSSEANSISSSSGPTNNVFGSSWQAPKTPSFASAFSSSSPSTGFQFGASASSAATCSAPLFGSSANTSSSSIFPFSSAAAATVSQPAFGNMGSVFAFDSTPSNNNNDQVGMEDSMAEDTVQASTPVPVFGQQPVTPSTGFAFGTTPSGANPFQFGSQQSLATPQNPCPFQASGSVNFNTGGGSFSLGSTVDKSQRKIVRAKSRHRKK